MLVDCEQGPTVYPAELNQGQASVVVGGRNHPSASEVVRN